MYTYTYMYVCAFYAHMYIHTQYRCAYNTELMMCVLFYYSTDANSMTVSLDTSVYSSSPVVNLPTVICTKFMCTRKQLC